MKSIYTYAAMVVLMSASLLVPTSAKAVTLPGHPRVQEVDNRVTRQEKRIEADANSGKITSQEAEQDAAIDAKVSLLLSEYEALDKGHITKKEDRMLNKMLNQNRNEIRQQSGQAKSLKAHR